MYVCAFVVSALLCMYIYIYIFLAYIYIYIYIYIYMQLPEIMRRLKDMNKLATFY